MKGSYSEGQYYNLQELELNGHSEHLLLLQLVLETTSVHPAVTK
jgi:hypothetical protein